MELIEGGAQSGGFARIASCDHNRLKINKIFDGANVPEMRALKA